MVKEETATLHLRVRHILRATVLLVFLLSLSGPVSALSSQNTPHTLFTQGMVNYGESRLRLWGVYSTDWGWGNGFIDQTHVNLLVDSHSTVIQVAIGKESWDMTPSDPSYDDNPLALPFRNYTETVVDMFQDGGIYVVIGLNKLDWNTDDASARDAIEDVGTARQDFIDWGIEVIQWLEPDAVLLMDEPVHYQDMIDYDITQAEYRDWCFDCIDQYRAIDPTLGIWTYPLPWTNFRAEGGFTTNPLENYGYSDIVYFTDIAYYDGDGGQTWESQYENGQLTLAKQTYYDYLDSHFDAMLDSERQLCLATGVRTDQGQSLVPNWDAMLNDTYQYCITHNIYVNHYEMSKGWRWTMLTDDAQDWNWEGQFYADNVPY